MSASAPTARVSTQAAMAASGCQSSCGPDPLQQHAHRAFATAADAEQPVVLAAHVVFCRARRAGRDDGARVQGEVGLEAAAGQEPERLAAGRDQHLRAGLAVGRTLGRDDGRKREGVAARGERAEVAHQRGEGRFQGVGHVQAYHRLECRPSPRARPDPHRNPFVNESAVATAIQTECVIVGAGPVGLFAVFELGLLGMKCEIVDSLAHPGGQCTELYPDKPIYDIPALPVCGAQELVDRLLEQIKPFHAGFHLGQEVAAVARQASRSLRAWRRPPARASTPAASSSRAASARSSRGGCWCPDAERYEGTQLHYRVRRAEEFHGKDVADRRRRRQRARLGARVLRQGAQRRRSCTAARSSAPQPASVARMKELAAAGQAAPSHEGTIQSLAIAGRPPDRRDDPAARDKSTVDVGCELVLACFGLHPKLGPIANWGLALEKKALRVDTEKFQTSEPGIFAIGDINTYPGKKKLILSGFHEAALAAFGVQHHVYPEKRQFLQYTTTSPIMRERLGVAPPD